MTRIRRRHETKEDSLTRHLPIAALLLMLFCPAVLAQNEAPAATGTNGPPVAFSQVTLRPIPLESTSGRFNSLNPPDKTLCHNDSVTGHVVSPRLIQIDDIGCKLTGGGYAGCCGAMQNVLMNVALATPDGRAKMVVGKTVTIKGIFVLAQEMHGTYNVSFLLAGNAGIVAGDPPDPSAAPTAPITSYIVCQAPEMDALATKLGHELCVQSSVLHLAADGAALEAAANALLSGTRAVSGDADAIACRQDPERSDAHLPAITCASRSYWDWWSIKLLRGQLFTRPAPP